MSAPSASRTPSLSVVIVIYNMEREARRSLHALSAAYQRDISADDYEVVVVDNGSLEPFNGGSVAEFGSNFRYHYVDDAHAAPANRTPARAINLGVALARSEYLALMIDGARIVTPRVLKYGLMLPKMFESPCGLTLGFHIGPDLQSKSIQQGYNQRVEDDVLAGIEWPANGYRLFEIGSTHDPSDGWFRLGGESNCTFVRRRLFDEVGGYDERYTSRGGGLVNMDFQTRLYALPRVDLVMIAGEGTFHQFHGGAASGTPWSAAEGVFTEYAAEYLAIRGIPYTPVTDRTATLIGHMPVEALGYLRRFIAVADPKLIDLDKTVAWLQREIAARDDVVAHRDRAIEWLRAELTEREKRIAELEASTDP